MRSLKYLRNTIRPFFPGAVAFAVVVTATDRVKESPVTTAAVAKRLVRVPPLRAPELLT
jgi:hypothetical protein